MWNARFQRSILCSDGRIIRTLYDVRAYIVSLPEDEQRTDKWDGLMRLLAIVADASDTEVVAHRFRDALKQRENDIPKKPSKPSTRKRSLQSRKRRK
jgi:hypothetical protein